MAPATTIRPLTIQAVKSILSSRPAIALIVSNGSSHQTSSSRPAAEYAARALAPAARASSTALMTAIEIPSENGVACSEATPAAARATPAAKPAAPSPTRRRPPRGAAVSGRPRTAATMFSTLTRQADTATIANVSSTPSAYATSRLRSVTACWISSPSLLNASESTATIPNATATPSAAPSAAAPRS